MPAIHQLTAGHTGYDAISNEARVLQRMIAGWGMESRIFTDAAHLPAELRHEAAPYMECLAAVRPEDWVLLHLSIGSPVNAYLAALPCRKAILYHNITPAEYFRAVNADLAERLAEGREQARALVGAAEVVLADSSFNAAELRELGYHDVHVFPLVLDLAPLRGPADPEMTARFADDDCTVLFVGRCAPNKGLDDALRVFEQFQHHHVPHSRFVHVGSAAGTERYAALCRALARELRIEQAHFLGALPTPALNALYRRADFFLCMSRHEGFCIPLLEAMVHDIPVVACDAGAVAETLDGAGVLAHGRDPAPLAETMAHIHNDPTLRHAIIRRQQQRLHRFELRKPDAELRSLLTRETT